MRLAIVVPTRNRSDLCLAAVDSVLRQKEDTDSVEVVISENSSDPEERSRLVSSLPRNVRLLVTDSDLPMSAHWDWALRETEIQVSPTHVAFLTDRSVLRAGMLQNLIRTIERHPEQVVSFSLNWVDDYDNNNIRVFDYGGDGRLYVMDSRSMLCATAKGRHWDGTWMMPRIVNSVVPVEVFSAMRREAGHVFASVAPDFYFGFRMLALRDNFLAINTPLVLDHTRRRSNGYSYVIGVASSDTDDFRSLTKVDEWMTPFPSITTIGNVIFHEYGVVRALSKSDRFPPVDVEGLRAVLMRDTASLVDPTMAADVRALLGDSSTLAGFPILRRSRFNHLLTSVAHPRRVIGRRLYYCALPMPLLIQLHRVFPGGRFATSHDALEIARRRPRPSIRSRPPFAGTQWRSA